MKGLYLSTRTTFFQFYFAVSTLSLSHTLSSHEVPFLHKTNRKTEVSEKATGLKFKHRNRTQYCPRSPIYWPFMSILLSRSISLLFKYSTGTDSVSHLKMLSHFNRVCNCESMGTFLLLSNLLLKFSQQRILRIFVNLGLVFDVLCAVCISVSTKKHDLIN